MTQPDTRTALLDVAERTVRARGHDGFSYADLSKAVGIRKASIHHHFPTKAGLLHVLMDRYRSTMIAHYEAIDANHTDAVDRLRAFIDLYRQALDGGERLCLCVALSIGRDGLDSAVHEEITAFRLATLDWLEAAFENGKHDGTLLSRHPSKSNAAACLATLEGAQLAARAARDVKFFDDATAVLRD